MAIHPPVHARPGLVHRQHILVLAPLVAYLIINDLQPEGIQLQATTHYHFKVQHLKAGSLQASPCRQLTQNCCVSAAGRTLLSFCRRSKSALILTLQYRLSRCR